MIDNIRFNKAIEDIVNKEREKNKIGLLSEKTLHAVFKNYLEDDLSKQEVKIKSYYADIMNEDGIYEVQTRQLNKLKSKLDCFLEDYEVTIVFPIPSSKWISWKNVDTGEITNKRLSPKKGTFYDSFFELYKIKNYLSNENLHLLLFLVDLDEYRYLNGWSIDKKRGSSRFDRIPKKLVDELFLKETNDYQVFISPLLPIEFSSKDYKQINKISLKTAQIALNILCYLKVIVRSGKKGKLYLYKRNFE